jgi:hypothetical protein
MNLNDTSSRRSWVEANDANLHAALLAIEAEKKALRTRMHRRCVRDPTGLQALACKSDEVGEHWIPRLQRATSDHQERRRSALEDDAEEADVEYVRVRRVHSKGGGSLILFEHDTQLSGGAADCADSSMVLRSPWADSPWETSPLLGSLCGLIMGMLACLCGSANSWFTYQ